ncbi:hypothetical protein RB195_003603 [Necator americanus]|uniref:ShKT domain-containing protein n=1 Tax=Necator americanus TaxID=51031 RepID=A0ABR1DPV6_NECAM
MIERRPVLTPLIAAVQNGPTSILTVISSASPGAQLLTQMHQRERDIKQEGFLATSPTVNYLVIYSFESDINFYFYSIYKFPVLFALQTDPLPIATVSIKKHFQTFFSMVQVFTVGILLFLFSLTMGEIDSNATEEVEGNLNEVDVSHPRAIVKRQTFCGTNRNCPHWVNNGFCRSSFYDTTTKMRYCGKECRLC